MPEDRSTVQDAIWGPTRRASAGRTGGHRKLAWRRRRGNLLIDYHQSHLIPFADGGGGAPVPVGSHPAGQAYGSGRPIEEDDHLYLPLIVYGERTGVLAVRCRSAPPPPKDLEAVAASLARALRLADNVTDIYREARRRKRLTIAAELQWELLPGRTCESAEFCLAGQLEPAYTVSGDNFDWSLSEDFLTLSASNGMGNGISAALLTQLTVNSLRNARRSGAGRPRRPSWPAASSTPSTAGSVIPPPC